MHFVRRWLYSIAGRRLRVWEAVTLQPVGVLRIGNNCGNVRCCLVLGTRVFLGCQVRALGDGGGGLGLTTVQRGRSNQHDL